MEALERLPKEFKKAFHEWLVVVRDTAELLGEPQPSLKEFIEGRGEPSPQVVAVHEAGHVVVGLAVGLRIEHVCISSSKGPQGWHGAAKIPGTRGDFTAIRRVLRSSAIAIYAGPLAQDRLLPDRSSSVSPLIRFYLRNGPDTGEGSDGKMVARMLEKYVGLRATGSAARAPLPPEAKYLADLRARLATRADELVTREARAIEALGDALLARPVKRGLRTLDHPAILAAVRPAASRELRRQLSRLAE